MIGIKLNFENNFEVRNGDFFINDTDLQDQQEIIAANKGNFLQYPTLGVGIDNYSSSPISRVELERSIRIEFAKDDINLVKVRVTQKDDEEFEINIVGERNEGN
jgi:hypothetical protein